MHSYNKCAHTQARAKRYSRRGIAHHGGMIRYAWKVVLEMSNLAPFKNNGASSGGQNEASMRLQLADKIASMDQRFEALDVETDVELALDVASKLTSASFDAFGANSSHRQQSPDMFNVCISPGIEPAAESSTV
jgi:hypothetical protein